GPASLGGARRGRPRRGRPRAGTRLSARPATQADRRDGVPSAGVPGRLVVRGPQDGRVPPDGQRLSPTGRPRARRGHPPGAEPVTTGGAGGPPGRHAALRENLVAYGRRMVDDGLVDGMSGNLSARAGDLIAITPSGLPYHDMAPADI